MRFCPTGAEEIEEALVAQVAERSGGNPLFAEEMVNRILEEGMSGDAALPETVHAVLAARLDALNPKERSLLQQASVVGQSFWAGSVAEGDDAQELLGSLADKDLIVATAGGRLMGEREYAFKHVLIRDVAYSTLPKTVRARKHAEVASFIEDRAADRTEAVIAMVADHLAKAAEIGTDAGLEESELHVVRDRAHEALEAAGDVAAGLYSNQEALTQYKAALKLDGDDNDCDHPDARARIAEKYGDVALRLGRVDKAVELWERCLDYHRGEENLARVGDLHRKIGAGLWNKGDREGSISHYQRGIDLLKDGPPCLELVRLYEEAASLYMHTGDNMLAIYASEKALRLAERLEEAAAASRAHGIFGRVFGRIGDTERARENLERSVELARDSDPSEAIRALLALGYHFETSEADYERGDRRLQRGARDRRADRRHPFAGRAPLLPLARSRSIAASGTRSRPAPRPSRRSWSARASPASSASPTSCAAPCAGATRTMRVPSAPFAAQRRWPRRSAARRSRSRRFSPLRRHFATASPTRTPTASWPPRSTRASGPDWSRSRSRPPPRARSTRRSGAEPTRPPRSPTRRRGLAERLRYPVGSAAALEARGLAAGDSALLREAAEAWRELGRPLEAERVARLAEAA